MTDRVHRFDRHSESTRRLSAASARSAVSVTSAAGVDNEYNAMFSGPGSESVPSSYTGFRRMSRSLSRHDDDRHLGRSFAGSVLSQAVSLSTDRSRHNSLDSESQFRFFSQDEIDATRVFSTDADDLFEEEEDYLFSTEEPVSSQRRSRRSTNGTDSPLLEHEDHDFKTASGDAQTTAQYLSSSQTQQRFYISEEDMMLVVAGYRTSRLRLCLYTVLCILTLGLSALVLRWFPRLRVSCIGVQAPLGACEWVIVENQWGELAQIHVQAHRYNRPLSSVFRTVHYAHPPSSDSDQSPTKAATVDLAGTHDDTALDTDSLSSFSLDPSLPYLRWFEYRYIRFLYHPGRDMYATNVDWVDSTWGQSTSSEGLDSDTVADREIVFGSNVIGIAAKSTLQLLIDEALHPFYVFQVFSIVLWSLDEYYYYAACIFVISVVSVANTLLETKKTIERIRELSRFECPVRVLRNGYWTTLPSGQLVPGDVYELSDPGLTLVPCDSVLVSGDCIVNESMLTGESVPVSKGSMTETAWQLLTAVDSDTSGVPLDVVKHHLYCGTELIRVQRPSSTDVSLGMVVRTGFSTTKGGLVRSMLFPKPAGFKFYEDSFKYIGFMAAIAVVGFVVCTVNFIRMGMPLSLMIFRALDIVTIVVPPALPATLTIGTNISLARLKKKDIFCISPNRVNVGGKLDVVCFDKTGTLTEDGLDVLGVRVVEQADDSVLEFSGLYDDISRADNPDMLEALATCHSLRLVDNKLLGDPLDIKMFGFTSWEFDEGEFNRSRNSYGPDGQRLECLKQFDFVSQLRRMSVVVRDQSTGKLRAIVKGAPEVMGDVCDPKSLPQDYVQQLQYYTHRGYRVIACAAKPLTLNTPTDQLLRQDVESDLRLVGFIIFENKLKPDSARVVKQLTLAKIRTIMCTGDNVFTAISVGTECHIVKEDTDVFVPFMERDENGDKIVWEPLDQESDMTLDPDTLKPVRYHDGYEYSLAITGAAFRYLLEYGTEDQIQQMLMRASIFARMSPDEKQELVEKLQGLGYTAGFCGDGANDCGALKAADVGISLSEAEASVAAPFTSRVFAITCVLDVIKEGRCALVTSFSCFKYMSLYSAIQFVSVSLLYSLGSNLGDFQFLWIDLFLILPIAIFMAWSKPYSTQSGSELSVKRPGANLVSRKILIPLVGHILTLLLVQVLAWTLVNYESDSSWYVPPIIGGSDDQVSSSPNTVIFYVSGFQYIFTAVVLSVGPPYREPVFKNGAFVLAIVITTGLTVFMMFAVHNDTPLARFMQLTELGGHMKAIVLVLALVNFWVTLVSDRVVFPALASVWRRVFRLLGWGKTQSNKAYKRVLAQEEC